VQTLIIRLRINIIAWVAIFVDRLMDGNPTSTRAAVA